ARSEVYGPGTTASVEVAGGRGARKAATRGRTGLIPVRTTGRDKRTAANHLAHRTAARVLRVGDHAGHARDGGTGDVWAAGVRSTTVARRSRVTGTERATVVVHLVPIWTIDVAHRTTSDVATTVLGHACIGLGADRATTHIVTYRAARTKQIIGRAAPGAGRSSRPARPAGGRATDRSAGTRAKDHPAGAARARYTGRGGRSTGRCCRVELGLAASQPDETCPHQGPCD